MMTSPSASTTGSSSGANYLQFQVSLLNLAFQGDLAPSITFELERNAAQHPETAAPRT